MKEEAERERMVREQLQQRDVHDARVLDAMRRVPRHLFVPEAYQEQAYADRPQPIGNRQTISQPVMVGFMTELLALHGGEHVLEIGTGSGYQTAVLAELCRHVTSVERHATLAERARDLLRWLGYRNVEVVVSDGSDGWPARAPYDRILVTAAAPAIPEPLLEQLALDGRLVMPVGGAEAQMLKLAIREGRGVTLSDQGECVFVPLVGAHGWPEPPPTGPAER